MERYFTESSWFTGLRLGTLSAVDVNIKTVFDNVLKSRCRSSLAPALHF